MKYLILHIRQRILLILNIFQDNNTKLIKILKSFIAKHEIVSFSI